MKMSEQVADILKRPYARVLTPDEDGRYTAELLEFPSCVSFGDNAHDALANLEEVAREWVIAAISQGQSIPEPMCATEYSGRTVLRMSKGLHQRAALCAEREGVSLNQFVVTCLAEAVGERTRHIQATSSSPSIIRLIDVGRPVTQESAFVSWYSYSGQQFHWTDKPDVIQRRSKAYARD